MPPQNPEQARWFAEEVQPHEPDLRAYLRRQFPKLTDVDDMVQESFVRLLRARETGRIACVRAYLFTIARNAANAVLRRPRIFDENPITDSSVLGIVETGADVAEQVSTSQEIALLLDAIDALPARCREIFILRKLQGVPQKEIARKLGLSEQTVQMQVARGATPACRPPPNGISTPGSRRIRGTPRRCARSKFRGPRSIGPGAMGSPMRWCRSWRRARVASRGQRGGFCAAARVALRRRGRAARRERDNSAEGAMTRLQRPRSRPLFLRRCN